MESGDLEARLWLGQVTVKRFLAAKIDFMTQCADHRYLREQGLDPVRWSDRMLHKKIASAIGLTTGSKTNEIGALNSLFSRAIRADGKLRPEQLMKLAEYAMMSPALGPPERAARLLIDDCDFTEFRGRLVSAGWADPETLLRGAYASRDTFIAALSAFNLLTGRVRVAEEKARGAAVGGPHRGARLPRRADREDNLPDHRLNCRLTLAIDGLTVERGLLLLELAPAPERLDGYAVTSLVPSRLAPKPVITPGQTVPTDSVEGISAFVMEGPQGLHDWLAILTPSPLKPPPSWPAAPEELHRLSLHEVDWVFATLRDIAGENGERAAAAGVEIRHYPFTLGLRG